MGEKDQPKPKGKDVEIQRESELPGGLIPEDKIDGLDDTGKITGKEK